MGRRAVLSGPDGGGARARPRQRRSKRAVSRPGARLRPRGVYGDRRRPHPPQGPPRREGGSCGARRRARPLRSPSPRSRTSALPRDGRRARGQDRARDRPLARDLLLGLALAASGHGVRDVFRGRRGSVAPSGASRTGPLLAFPDETRYRCPRESMDEERAPPGGGPTFRWFLESLVEGGRQLRRVAVHPLPYRIGRRPGLDLTLPSDGVSKEHAEIYTDGDGLRVRDLGSKNGTFLNRRRVEDSPLQEGDILHFAQLEFRLGRQEIEQPGAEAALEPPTLSITNMALPKQFLEQTKELPELLQEGMVSTLFQPVVALPAGTIAGYEVLGRGCHPRLPETPPELFQLAAGVNAQAELSRLFRRVALEALAGKRDVGTIFLNTH